MGEPKQSREWLGELYGEWLGWIHLKSFGGYTAGEITGRDAMRLEPVIWQGLIREGDRFVISAPQKTGKTWFLIHMAIHAALGNEFLGHRFERCRVILFTLESSINEVSHRMERVRRVLGVSESEASLNRIQVFPYDLRHNINDIVQICEDIGETFPSDQKLIIVDPLYKLEEGDEIDFEKMKRLMDSLEQATLRCPHSALVFTHHPRKGGNADADVLEVGAGSGVVGRSVTGGMSMHGLVVDEKDTEAFNWLECNRDVSSDGTVYYPRPLRIRVSEGRSFASCGPIDVVFKYPEFGTVAEVTGVPGLFDECVIDGSEAARRKKGGKATAEANEIKRSSKIRRINAAMRQCRAAEVPCTVDNVFSRYGEICSSEGAEPISLDTFKKWTKPSNKKMPFHTENGEMVFEDGGID